MKKRQLAWLLPSCLLAGLTIAVQSMPALASEETDSLVGHMAFAQCEEYINIRSEASTEGEVTAKIYNNGSAIIEEVDGEWYKIRSGNAEGYVKAEYFATGKEAEAIAEKIAYNVATVYPEELNIRATPGEQSGVIGNASKDQELEVVSWDGDWMKVALSADEFGYINAYYVDYHTYYPVAETLEEEAARLRAEQLSAESADYSDKGSSVSVSNDSDTGTSAPETTDSETETYVPETGISQEEVYVPETNAPETEAYVPETSSPETEEYVPETNAPETEEYVPETSAPETEEYVPETSAPETEEYVPETSAPETEEYVPETSAPETEEYVPETNAPETEEYVPETSAPETEEYVPETNAPEAEEYIPETSAPETEAVSSSSLGQQIADYGVQFVGNPYVWGGTSLTNGADCSGFTQSVFANFGIYLARTAESQAYGGTSVSLDQLQPGDLLFYNSTGSIDHVAIYIGGGQIVHAANSTKGIIISSAYYATPVRACRYW